MSNEPWMHKYYGDFDLSSLSTEVLKAISGELYCSSCLSPQGYDCLRAVIKVLVSRTKLKRILTNVI